MKAKVAYQTRDFQSGIVEFDFQWSEWSGGTPLEEAATIQVQIYVKEKLYEEVDVDKRTIDSYVVLDGELKQWLQNNYTDPLDVI